ncbi:MAG: PilN domain-containing protein [Oligoflexia bacterium]|nr:PilN domain-containing protein [Oligoflexia bacterium]
MIEVNLIGTKKQFKLPVIMGVDLGLINFKWIIIVLIFDMLRGTIYENGWKKDNIVHQSKIDTAKQELEKTIEEGKKLEGVKQDVELLEKQELKLNEKLGVVKKIIKIKKNPMNMLLFIAKNLPEDVWVDNIELTNDQLTVTGQAMSYKSIGKFIDNLKESIFFGANNVKLEDSGTGMQSENTNKRSEFFKIKATITRYE